MTDKRVYVEFEVTIRDEEYLYDATRASEQLTLILPSLEFFSELDTGNLFKALSLNLEAKFRQVLREKASHEDDKQKNDQ